MSNTEETKAFDHGYVQGLKFAVEVASHAPEPVYRLSELGKVGVEQHGQNVGQMIRSAIRDAYNTAANRLEASESRE